jgi:hypothetical protein
MNFASTTTYPTTTTCKQRCRCRSPAYRSSTATAELLLDSRYDLKRIPSGAEHSNLSNHAQHVITVAAILSSLLAGITAAFGLRRSL